MKLHGVDYPSLLKIAVDVREKERTGEIYTITLNGKTMKGTPAYCIKDEAMAEAVNLLLADDTATRYGVQTWTCTGETKDRQYYKTATPGIIEDILPW